MVSGYRYLLVFDILEGKPICVWGERRVFFHLRRDYRAFSIANYAFLRLPDAIGFGFGVSVKDFPPRAESARWMWPAKSGLFGHMYVKYAMICVMRVGTLTRPD